MDEINETYYERLSRARDTDDRKTESAEIVEGGAWVTVRAWFPNPGCDEPGCLNDATKITDDKGLTYCDEHST